MGNANKKLILLALIGLIAMAAFMASKVFRRTPPPTPIYSPDAESVSPPPAEVPEGSNPTSKREELPKAILVQGGGIPTFRMPPPKKAKTSPTPCSSKAGSIVDPGCKVE